MKKNKISVIVPIYKVEKYLDKCVESIINQSYKELEIILVDDGSPDNCGKMCDVWATKDNRISVIHKQNGGLSEARNYGIEKATGDYIAFIDSDDYIEKTYFEDLLKLIQENNCDVSCCGYTLVYEEKNDCDNTEINLKELDESIRIFEGEEVINQLYKTDIGLLMIACCKLYKRKIFDEVRYPVGKLHEDEYAIVDVLRQTKRFVVTTKKLYNYLQRKGSITKKKSDKNINDALEGYLYKFNVLQKYYPNKSNQNIELYLSNIRGIYLTGYKLNKQIKKKIVKEYNYYYKYLGKKSLKDVLFRYLRPVYKVLYKFKKR